MAGTRWHNADGLEVPFGNYWKTPANFVNRSRSVSTLGANKQIVYDVDLTQVATGTTTYTSDLNNDGTNDGFNTGDVYLPAYASVISVIAYVTEAAAGGTSFTLGTYLLDGTAISATSLITATEGVKANFDTLGARTYGAGALVSTSVETASVGAADAYIALAGTGTWTAGKLRVVITYNDPLGDS